MTQPKFSKNRFSQNMWKKLLVFAVAFCFGLVSSQIFKYQAKPAEVEVVPDTTNLNEPASSSPKASETPISKFKTYLSKLKKAVAENDRETVAALMDFPLIISEPKKTGRNRSRVIKTGEQFLANYDKIFDESTKKSVARMNPDQWCFSTGGEVFLTSPKKINQSFLTVSMFWDYRKHDPNFEPKIKYFSEFQIFQ